MSLIVDEVSSIARLKGEKQDYMDILQTSGEDPLFLNLDWLMAWWSAFGDDRKPMILRVTEDGQPVGYAPLAVYDNGRYWAKVTFMGSGPSDRCGFIAKDGRVDIHDAIWNYLKERDDWDVIELRDMRQGGPTERSARKAFPNCEMATEVAPFIRLAGDFDDYISSLSRSMRSTVGRGWRRLQEHGAIFKDMRTAEGVNEAVQWLKELHNQRWQSSSCLSLPGMSKFIGEVTKRMIGHGIVFHAILINETPQAIAMGLEDKERYLYYMTGFGPEYEKYSPGNVLLSNIIKECHQQGRTEVDMLRGSETYKYRFRAVDRPHIHIRAVNRGLVRRTQYSLREAPLV
ncbi:MAG: GNAT family N-acetyltransferase [Euryarchaeota archaeon]|nr:GNAT family N-acetyltransferase [Euryarchaeota archaeon]